jgi:hypothetical protein
MIIRFVVLFKTPLFDQFKGEAPGIIKCLAGSCLSELGIVLKAPSAT